MGWSGLVNIGVIGFGSAAVLAGVWVVGQLRAEQKSALLLSPNQRLRNWDELQQAAKRGFRLDVNQASIDQWLQLPGISIHQARLLVDLTQNGVPFHCLEDLSAALEVPPSTLAPLMPVLQFAYYDLDSRGFATKVNVNQATLQQLQTVPGVDLRLARKIVQQRKTKPFNNLRDLQKRLQLSGDRVAEWMHYLRFS